MRFFQYTARDSRNQNVGGTMQALTEDEARQSLSKFGLQVLSVQELSSPTPPPSVTMPILQRAPASPPRVAAPQVAPPRTGPRAEPQPTQASPYNYNRPVTLNSIPSTVPVDVVHTPAGTDKQRFFLFSQLASALRAGINPSHAFLEVGQRTAGQFRPSLDEAAAATAEGKTISQVFARYPDLYPEHVVGVVRAGEVAGFVPDAMDEVARQAETSHSFRRMYFWVWFLTVNFLLTIPGVWITTRGMLGMIDTLNKNGGAGGSAGGLSALGQALWQSLLWPWGPITLIGYGAIWVFQRYYMSGVAKPMRHRIGLKFPVYGPRSRQENLARFAWTMSRVGRAGIAPARAWQLAADAVPNLAFRDELIDVGSQMKESTRMSDVIHRSPLFPDEYAPMVATAEYTGDLPSAMDRLAQVSAGEFVAAQNYAKARSGCWILLAFFITSAIAYGMFSWSWLHEVPDKLLGPDNPLNPGP
jgi:type II secretory pathway component PulF